MLPDEPGHVKQYPNLLYLVVAYLCNSWYGSCKKLCFCSPHPPHPPRRLSRITKKHLTPTTMIQGQCDSKPSSQKLEKNTSAPAVQICQWLGLLSHGVWQPQVSEVTGVSCFLLGINGKTETAYPKNQRQTNPQKGKHSFGGKFFLGPPPKKKERKRRSGVHRFSCWCPFKIHQKGVGVASKENHPNGNHIRSLAPYAGEVGEIRSMSRKQQKREQGFGEQMALKNKQHPC